MIYTLNDKLEKKSPAPDFSWVYELIGDDPHLQGWTSSSIESEFQRAEGLWCVNQGQVRAFLLYRKILDVYEITLLATHPAYLRQGIMKKLLHYLRLMMRGGDQIWLEVHESNLVAMEFYETQGFVRGGTRPHYYSDGASAYLFSFEKP